MGSARGGGDTGAVADLVAGVDDHLVAFLEAAQNLRKFGIHLPDVHLGEARARLTKAAQSVP